MNRVPPTARRSGFEPDNIGSNPIPGDKQGELSMECFKLIVLGYTLSAGLLMYPLTFLTLLFCIVILFWWTNRHRRNPDYY